MEKSASFPSNKQASVLKRNYRMLRSKVLKILDEKFLHPSEDVIQYDAKIAQIQSAFRKVKDRELLDNQDPNYRPPKIYDYTFYNPDYKSLKYPKPEKTFKTQQDLESLKLENLCKYLTFDEIELVCEDPIYFLGREEYRINQELNDHKGWNKQLAWVKEKRKKEANWKETMNDMKKTFQSSPRIETFQKLANKTDTAMTNKNLGWNKELKENMLKIQSRKIMARNNQMNSLIAIRKAEELENKKDREYAWNFKLNERHTKVLEKKEEALKMWKKEREYERTELDKKLAQKAKERQDFHTVTKITQQIDYFFKGKTTEESKVKDLQNKINKARNLTDFKYRKPFFAAKVGEDMESEDSRNQSHSTYK